MKCPHCGKETKSEEACEHCRKALLPVQGMEVRYKDFKLSELLDIKMPGQGPAPQEDRGAEEERSIERKAAAGGRPAGRKASRVVLVAVIILLAAAAGFFLLKLLLKF
jgi:hypothetical protein